MTAVEDQNEEGKNCLDPFGYGPRDTLPRGSVRNVNVRWASCLSDSVHEIKPQISPQCIFQR